jgi:hypothetical protein
MRAKACVNILALTVVVFGQAAAQSEWKQKPFQEWTKQEAEKVLNDSPWAVKQEVRIRYAGTVSSVAGAPTAAEASGGLLRSDANTASLGGARAPVDFVFTLRLRSALPVRQAMARLKQLEAKNEKTGKKDGPSLDQMVKGLLECPACANNYVLTLSSKSTESPGADAAYTIFGGAKLADLKRYLVISNDRGERRELIHFVPPKAPGEEAVFFFPRLDDKGVPLVTPETRTIIFNVTNGEVNNIVNFKINVSTLVADGVIQF